MRLDEILEATRPIRSCPSAGGSIPWIRARRDCPIQAGVLGDCRMDEFVQTIQDRSCAGPCPVALFAIFFGMTQEPPGRRLPRAAHREMLVAGMAGS